MILPFPGSQVPVFRWLLEPPDSVIAPATLKKFNYVQWSLRCLLIVHIAATVALLLSPAPRLATVNAVVCFVGYIAVRGRMAAQYFILCFVAALEALQALTLYSRRIWLPEFGYSYTRRVLIIAAQFLKELEQTYDPVRGDVNIVNRTSLAFASWSTPAPPLSLFPVSLDGFVALASLRPTDWKIQLEKTGLLISMLLGVVECGLAGFMGHKLKKTVTVSIRRLVEGRLSETTPLVEPEVGGAASTTEGDTAAVALPPDASVAAPPITLFSGPAVRLTDYRP